MATFTTTPNQQVDFDDFDIDDLVGNYLYLASPTTWRTGPFASNIGTYVDIQGVGLTYSNGSLTGGTITTITSYSAGSFDFEINNISIPAASFNTYRANGDTAEFLAEIFSGDDTINGANLNDFLNGYAGADHLEGKDGDDILYGGTGDDTLVGGKGADVYVIDSVGDVIVETGGSSGDRVSSSISVDLTLAAFNGIEDATLRDNAGNLSATGDSGANVLRGNNGDNVLAGNSGNDQIWGNAGNDSLDGGAGGDQMYGGSGDDTYTVDSVVDTVSETLPNNADSGGVDTVFSNTKDFTLPNYFENLTLIGSAMNGNGNALANTLIGNANANVLDGKTGYDTMIGGDGNDTYVVNSAKDVVTETSAGGTKDEVYSSALAYTLPSYVEHLYLSGNAGISGTGNDLNNTIYGNGAANKIDGGAGHDSIFGGAGDDTLIGGDGNDSLRGGTGDDTIDASLGNDTVYYTNKLDGYDVIEGFDGDPTGGQDYLDLVLYFEIANVNLADRAARVGLVDNGAVVDVWIDVDGNKSLDTKVAEIHTADTLKVGEDVTVFYVT